jgi:hypothetical protein
VAHELGHSLGNVGDAFAGVDSKKYSASKYDSIMNYNAASDVVKYNDGEPFDDWEHMREQKLGYDELDVSKLQQVWKKGSV